MNISAVITMATIVFAFVAIYVLYSIIMFKGVKNKNGELQLSTKNILEQVKVLYEKEEYALVELLATKYLDRMPNSSEVRQFLAKAYFKTKKYNNCMKQCSLIIKKTPNNIDVRKLLGDCYVKKQMYAKAIKEFEGIFDYKKNDSEVVRTLAELYRETDQIYSAVSIYNILNGLLIDSQEIADLQLILAELNEEIRDYPAAFDAYKLRLEIMPTDIDTNKRLASLYIKINNSQKAIETLSYMLTFVTEPKDLLWIYEHIVNIHIENEDYEKAIEFLTKMAEVSGADRFGIETQIALLDIKLDRDSQGIAILEELSMMSNNGYEVTLELCASYLKCKEYEKALAKYTTLLDKATQKEAKNIRLLICEMYISWAKDRFENGDIATSDKYLSLAENFNPLNPDVYYKQALNEISKQNFSTSIELLNKAIEYDKMGEQHTKYLLTLSDAHHALGNFFEEKKALTDLLNIDPKHAVGLYKNGLMYVALGDVKKAEDSFKSAIANDDELIEAKYNLALLYESNNRDKAKELYIEVLEQDPSFVEAKNALADFEASDL